MMMLQEQTATVVIQTTYNDNNKKQQPSRRRFVRFNEPANEYHESCVGAVDHDGLLRDLWYSSQEYKAFRWANRSLTKSSAQSEMYQRDDSASFANVLMNAYGACVESASTGGHKPVLTTREKALLKRTFSGTTAIIRLGLEAKIVKEIGQHRLLLRRELRQLVLEGKDTADEILRQKCERRSHVSRWFAHIAAQAQWEASNC